MGSFGAQKRPCLREGAKMVIGTEGWVPSSCMSECGKKRPRSWKGSRNRRRFLQWECAILKQLRGSVQGKSWKQHQNIPKSQMWNYMLLTHLRVESFGSCCVASAPFKVLPPVKHKLQPKSIIRNSRWIPQSVVMWPVFTESLPPVLWNQQSHPWFSCCRAGRSWCTSL